MAKRRFRSRGRFSRLRRRRRGGIKRFSRAVKRVIRKCTEVKYATKAPAGVQTQDGFLGVVLALNPDIPQGVDRNERISNKIRYKYAQFRLSVAITSSTLNPPPTMSIVRILLTVPRIEPTGGNAVGITGAELMDDATSGVQLVHSSVNNKVARVIMDRTYIMQNLNNDPTTVQNQNHYGLIYIKKKFRVYNSCLFRSVTQLTPGDPKDWFNLQIFTNANANGDIAIRYVPHFRLSYIDM